MKLRKVTAASASRPRPRPDRDGLRRRRRGSDAGSGSAGGGGTIKVGIKFDQPGLGLKKPDGFSPASTWTWRRTWPRSSATTPDQIEWVETKSADRENALARGDVKFIAATYSITDERKEKVDFAGPYLLAHQDLLVKDDSKISRGHGPQRQEAVLGDRLHLGAERPGRVRPEGPAQAVRRRTRSASPVCRAAPSTR